MNGRKNPQRHNRTTVAPLSLPLHEIFHNPWIVCVRQHYTSLAITFIVAVVDGPLDAPISACQRKLPYKTDKRNSYIGIRVNPYWYQLHVANGMRKFFEFILRHCACVQYALSTIHSHKICNRENFLSRPSLSLYSLFTNKWTLRTSAS